MLRRRLQATPPGGQQEERMSSPPRFCQGLFGFWSVYRYGSVRSPMTHARIDDAPKGNQSVVNQLVVGNQAINDQLIYCYNQPAISCYISWAGLRRRQQAADPAKAMRSVGPWHKGSSRPPTIKRRKQSSGSNRMRHSQAEAGLLQIPGPAPRPHNICCQSFPSAPITHINPSSPRTYRPAGRRRAHARTCSVLRGTNNRAGMMRRRPGLVWAGALLAVLVLLAACTAAAAVSISRRQQHRHGGAPAASAARGGCDAFAAGRWVVDESYPLYDSARCPFIRDEFACARFGRPDTAYLKYRWQLDPPCAQPRFDGLALLRMWRGKTVMFVGDSLALNQYESLLCMLHAAAPGARTTVSPASGKIDPSYTVRFEDYNVTLVYYLTHYLVDLVAERSGRVLKLDTIEQASNWLAADVLVFDSWHWWPRAGPTQPWDFIQEGNTVVRDMDRTRAFTKALHTWANWVDANLLHTDTKVFFQGISPSHYRGEDWGASAKKTCMGETQPLNGTGPYPGGPIPQQAILRSVLAGMAKPVYLLDFTYLSQLRKDAHPTKYDGGIFGGDCTHWCVAGLPDTWNVLFYGALTGQF